MIILFIVQAVVPQVNIESLQAEVAQLKKENEQIYLLKEEIEGEYTTNLDCLMKLCMSIL